MTATRCDKAALELRLEKLTKSYHKACWAYARASDGLLARELEIEAIVHKCNLVKEKLKGFRVNSAIPTRDSTSCSFL